MTEASLSPGPYPFYTVGHSNRTSDELIRILDEAGVRFVADVRTVPRSRAQPQFNADTLGATLREAGIGYEHLPALGGLRKRSREIPVTVNGFWENQSFHNYADYAMGETFAAGLRWLRWIGHASPCAIMCAEAVWWRCHRRIISDYLLLAGETVLHILGHGNTQPATLTSAARATPAGLVTYPPAV